MSEARDEVEELAGILFFIRHDEQRWIDCHESNKGPFRAVAKKLLSLVNNRLTVAELKSYESGFKDGASSVTAGIVWPEEIKECQHQSVNPKQLCYRCINANEMLFACKEAVEKAQ